MTFRVRRASNRRRRQSASPAGYSAADRNCTSGILGIAGIVLALWSASNYVAAFMRASNAIYDVPEGRPIWKTAPIRLGVTVVTMILLVAAAFIVVVTGSLARKVGDVLGIGATAVSVWDIAKWPVLLIIIGLILAILFWASPNARHGFQWVSPSLSGAAPWPPGIRPTASLSRNYGTTASCGRKRRDHAAEAPRRTY